MQDASGNPQDASGNGLHMTTTNGTPDYQQPGPMNDFSINCDFTEFFNRSDVSAVTTNWTVELFWYPTNVGAAGRTVTRTDQNGTTTGWGIGTNPSATDTKFCGVLGNSSRANSVAAPPLNTWSHIVVLRREDTPGVSHWEYYYNGSVDSNPVADSAPGVPAGITQINAGNFLAARYAYVAIYETALSAARIIAHVTAMGGSTPATRWLSAVGW